MQVACTRIRAWEGVGDGTGYVGFNVTKEMSPFSRYFVVKPTRLMAFIVLG